MGASEKEGVKKKNRWHTKAHVTQQIQRKETRLLAGECGVWKAASTTLAFVQHCAAFGEKLPDCPLQSIFNTVRSWVLILSAVGIKN